MHDPELGFRLWWPVHAEGPAAPGRAVGCKVGAPSLAQAPHGVRPAVAGGAGGAAGKLGVNGQGVCCRDAEGLLEIGR